MVCTREGLDDFEDAFHLLAQLVEGGATLVSGDDIVHGFPPPLNLIDRRIVDGLERQFELSIGDQPTRENRPLYGAWSRIHSWIYSLTTSPKPPGATPCQKNSRVGAAAMPSSMRSRASRCSPTHAIVWTVNVSPGGAYWITMLLEEGQLRVIQGTLRAFRMTAESGNGKAMHFCPECGAMIFARAAARPGLVSLRPGTLDDTSWVTPQAHIWTKSKQRGVAWPNDVPVFETAYDAAAVWPEESLRRVAQITS